MLVAAGGTGGHLFPAEALAAALAKRNIAVALATDARAARLRRRVSRRRASMSSRAPPSAAAIRFRWRRPAALLGLRRAARPGSCCRRSGPSVVVGFGGYPTIPPLLAASLRGIPTVIHEQNAVMGRANRMLAPRVTRDRDRLCRRPQPRAGARREGDAHRQSGAAGGDRGGGDALSGARHRRAAAACWCSAAARARA